jgi:hypothetical protein
MEKMQKDGLHIFSFQNIVGGQISKDKFPRILSTHASDEKLMQNCNWNKLKKEIT